MSETGGATEERKSEAVAPRRRLERRTDDKVVAGVCSGLGSYFEIDPLWFRIGFVIASLSGAMGVILYLAAWALMPLPGQPSPLQRKRSPVTLIGAALLIVAAGMMLPILEALIQLGTSPFGPIGLDYPVIDYFPGPAFLALGLIAIGVVLLRQRDEGRGPLAPRAPTGAEQRAIVERTITEPDATTATDDMTTSIAYAPPVPARRRERSALSAFITAAVLIVVGTAALLSSGEIASIDVGQLTALALFVIGAGLLVGAWWGRARLMVVVGVFLIPTVLASSVVDFPLNGAVGSTYITPRHEGDLKDLDYTFGSVQLDLTEYRFEARSTSLDIRMGVGSVQVAVPTQVHALVTVETRSGEVYVFREHESGTDIAMREEAGDTAGSDKTVRINITGGLTSVSVYRTRWSYL
ncbi:MAG: PspC domain-containing protein, partial [Actinomycetota bacterium]